MKKNYADEVVKTFVRPNEAMEHIRESELNACMSLALHKMVEEGALKYSVVSDDPEQTRFLPFEDVDAIYHDKRLQCYPKIFRAFAYL